MPDKQASVAAAGGATAKAPAAHKRLGELLLEGGKISQAELDEAVALRKVEGGFIGQILARLGYVTQEIVASCLVKQCKIPHLSLLDYDIGVDVLSLVPKEICAKHKLLPIDKLGRILTVAMVDPLDLDALQEVRDVCPELRIKPIMCNWDHFNLVAAKVLGEKGKGKGGATMTADSLGLSSALAPAPKPTAAKAPPPKTAPANDNKPGPAGAAPSATLDLMQEAVAAVTEELRGTAGTSHDALAAIVRESIEANQQAQQEQSARLAEIAETMLKSVKQSSQMLESATVAEGVRQDLTKTKTGPDAIAPLGAIANAPGGGDAALAEADARILEALESEDLRETLIFDNFVFGPANEFTLKLAKGVSAHPGEDYNPFFLFGTVGVGKTHLASAVGNAIRNAESKFRVGYVSSSHFSRKLMDATKVGALGQFRTSYCQWDVLILDDIQFLGGRVEAQEEFFHIFNALHEQGRQIIIVSDKAPDRLGLLEERLVSRFAGGIVAELKAPEWETRMEILRHQEIVIRQGAGAKSSKRVEVPEEVLSLIATRVPSDMRKMMGALRKIVAYASLVEQEMSRELADDILNHLGAEETA